MGPWAHELCSHPQEVLPHPMHLLSWGNGSTGGTGHVPAQLCCHTQPPRPRECLRPSSLHGQWTLSKLCNVLFVCSVFPGQLMPLGPDSPGSLAAPQLIRTHLLPGRGTGHWVCSTPVLGSMEEVTAIPGTREQSPAWHMLPLPCMAQARPGASSSRNMGRTWNASGKALEQGGHVPSPDTDTEGTCCSDSSGTAGPSSPSALPGKGAPG